jgi:hypothetical protein
MATAADWDALSEDKTSKKKAQKNPPKAPSKKGLDSLKKFFTKRTIFKGMNWILYGDTGDGKTYTICSAANIAPVFIIDTEFRAQDTSLLEFPDTKYDINVVEPVVMKRVMEDGEYKSVMDIEVTLDQTNKFVTQLCDLVEEGEVPEGSIVAVESMSDFWDEIQYEGKRQQAQMAGKTITELAQDGNIEWSDIKQKHKNLVLQLNALRSKGINIIYSARRNDTDSNAKAREIRSEKNLAFDTQNIVKLHSDMVDGKKVHYATFEKMLGKHCYDTLEMPDFQMMDSFVRDKVNEVLKR